MERGGGLPSPIKLPYFPDQARELTRRYERVIVAGTRRPVAFFGHPGLPSYLTTEEQTVILTGPGEDTLGALAALASEVNAPDVIDQVPGTPPAMPKGALDAQSVSAVIARLQPLDCIVMDEVLAVGVPYFDASKHSRQFTHLMLTGGAIGQGPGAATGATIACPNRKVINFQSDGCGCLFCTSVLDPGPRKFGCRYDHRLQPQLSNSRGGVTAGRCGPPGADCSLHVGLG